MFTVSGYRTVDQLQDGAQSLVLRAIRESDECPVILKVLKDSQPSSDRIARFKREHQLLHDLDLPGVVDVYDFLHTSSYWLFAQEDFGGTSLDRSDLIGNVELDQFLTIARQVAEHVTALHRHKIIHKDLTPANIVINRNTGVIKLIDFGIATRLSRETVAFDHPSLIEGTPAYLAPEQTGRTNRPLDHRADLYSLGCTFYELLTGHPPFQADNLLELMHCHLAREAESLLSLRPEIPIPVSEIIHTLLAKNADERYQSAHGLLADLRYCQEQRQQHASIEIFPLREREVTQHLATPTRLYGRRAELAKLLGCYQRAAAGGTELLLISGSPGIGKSALVRELYQPVTTSHGFFASGKFDQFRRDTPYQPVVEALDKLIGQVLMEPPEQVTQWAGHLKHAAGQMLPTVADILPRLELLYTQLPPTPNLSTTEFNFRFVRALAECIRVFAGPDHPLVLFIDDLQWADSASLDLLELLTTGDPIAHLMIVGAYRHEEIKAAHPLQATLQVIRDAGVDFEVQSLGPLTTRDTAELLSDLLHRDTEAIHEPAQLIHQKTGGNPFFIHTVLDSLVTEEIMYFDHELNSWTWRDDRLRLLELSDNVVDLVVANLERLPQSTRELLTLASCIGNEFQIELLASITDQPASEVAQALTPAIISNYLIPTTGNYRLFEADFEELDAQPEVAYKFAHDRIQHASYNLGSADSHSSIHLRIGRAMLANLPDVPGEGSLLPTINQLNRAGDLIDNPYERSQVAALNLAAGNKARAAVANASALEYFEQGLLFLGSQPYQRPTFEVRQARARTTDPMLTRSLTESAAEAAYLDSNFSVTNRYVDEILRHAEHNLDRVKATQLRVNALTAQNEFLASIAAARSILQPLDIDLPDEPTTEHVDARLASVTQALGDRSPRELAQLPAMTDGQAQATIKLCNSILTPAFLAQPLTYLIVTAEMVLLTLRHGLAPDSARAFVFLGMSLCARGELDLGYEFGCLAELLVERDQLSDQRPNLAVVGGCYVFHWRRPCRDSIRPMRDGYRAGLESGSIDTGCNSLQCSSAIGFLSGCELPRIDEEYAESDKALVRYKQGPYLTWLRQYHQAVQAFRGLSEDPTSLRGAIYDETEELPRHKESGDLTAIYMLDFNKMMLRYHFHDFDGALQSARALIGGNQPGSIWLMIATFYQCLAALSVYDNATDDVRESLLDEVEPLLETMKQGAEFSPTNYAHKFELMCAELCRVTGRAKDAREHYDRAIDRAREHEYTQEEGLALERAALFYHTRGNMRLASYYMRDAYYAFERWGATAKLEFLTARYGYLLQRERDRARPTSQATTATTATSNLRDLDLDTVLAANRAIASETDGTTMLRTIMRVSLEHAGAERGFLILVRDQRLLVKVRGTLDESDRIEAVSLALSDQEGLARSVVQYVARTAEAVILHDATTQGIFTQDPHIRANACESILCMPILNQGRLVAITYLENGRAVGVFDEDRLDLLRLLMGQAAVSIENALLREGSGDSDFHFRVGGSVPADSPTYVRRRADELLTAQIEQGEFCYIFNSRQMGKSSLRVRAVDRLRKTGIACISLDISALGSRNITDQQWYAGIARALVTGLGLQGQLDLRRWWRAHDELAAVQRLDVLVDEEILDRVDRPIALLIDEVDAVLSLDFSSDDFFALLRLFYNRRADDVRYRRLSVILLGVATPADLIRDNRRTPFNIGRAIPLAGFRFDEARNLATGLAHIGNGERLLRAILDWTCGQPFLTQKLCSIISEEESRPTEDKEREWVANLVRSRIIDKWRTHDDPEHLGTIEARLLAVPDEVPALLERYQAVLDGGEVDSDDSSLETSLVLSGLVTRTYDKVCVGNPIYAAIFDQAWIDHVLGMPNTGGVDT
ncbi:MAG: AAA family ATPase [Myxococcota bacterium]